MRDWPHSLKGGRGFTSLETWKGPPREQKHPCKSSATPPPVPFRTAEVLELFHIALVTVVLIHQLKTFSLLMGSINVFTVLY